MANRLPPRTKQLGIRVPARLGDRLDALAAREHNSVSSVVRRLLTAALTRDAAGQLDTRSTDSGADR